MAMFKPALQDWNSAAEEKRESVLEPWEKTEPKETFHFAPFRHRRSHNDMPLYTAPRKAMLFWHESQMSLATEFNKLVKRWRDATMFSSIMADIVLHPAYQRIIGLGPRAVPLILKELEKNEEPWYAALRALTGHEPQWIDDGDFANLRHAWLEWGKSLGLMELDDLSMQATHAEMQTSNGQTHQG